MTQLMTLWAAVALALLPAASPAQSVTVDEGNFTVTLAGVEVGTEEFSIRRTGPGTDGTLIANAVVSLRLPGGTQELRPLLQAEPASGTAAGYQMKVSGAATVEIQLGLVGRRYVSVVRSPEGNEEREFQARPETRILEEHVAHHYYFLRDVREGGTVSVIEPRTRTQTRLTAGSWTDEELRTVGGTVAVRRVSFATGSDVRTVWFDRQGRVVRVEIPAQQYVATRTDLIG